jgi:hypothetical protein
MRFTIIALAVALPAFGCMPKPMTMPGAELAVAEIGVQPKSGVALVGTFDFDITGDAEGHGCYDPRSRGFKYGSIPGTEKQANAAVSGAQAAALYDALTKSGGADTILVTWTKVDVQADGSACAEVHGKAVRLRKGPTVMPKSEADHGAQTPPPSPPPAPMPPAAPVTK